METLGSDNGDAKHERRVRLAKYASFTSLLILAACLGALLVLLLDLSLSDQELKTEPESPAATVASTEASAEASPSSSTTPSPSNTPTTTPIPTGLVYSGELPAALPGINLRKVGSLIDLAFSTAEGGVYQLVHRYYVPVAAIGTGVDTLSRKQLEDLASGAITDWAEVGGIPGPVRAFALAQEEDGNERAINFGPKLPDQTFTTYENLLKAMTLDSGAWAFLPIDEIGPMVTAISVNGIDLVRGRGDPKEWPFVDQVTLLALTEEGRREAEKLLDIHSAPLPKPVTVIATGDILQSRCSLTQIRATGDWGSALRGPVGEYLASADLTLGSIDGSIQDIAEPLGCFPHVNLSSPPEVIEALTLSGFDEVTVATNHVFDCGALPCGADAFLRTIELLEEAGIAVVGGGENLEEALKPAIFTIGKTTFGILGFDDVAAYFLAAGPTWPGTAPLDDDYTEENAAGEPSFFRPASELGLERFRARISELAEEVDVVIVQVQTGTEDTHDPSPRSIKALQAAVAEGATLVIGNQAHHVQAVELGEESFIAYALGNFIYDQERLEGHTQGFLLEATFWDARLVNIRFKPYVIENLYRPAFAQGEVRTKILNDIFQASLRLAAGQ
tara:strand:+ start:2323 stop:4176 length:1854 start_codon:yes stop_codon:yes gene_type:complete